MARLGMHFSLWAPSWTREAAEAALPEAAKHGLQVIEIPLMRPETVDVAHAKSVLAQYGLSPSASLCLPLDRMAQDNPEGAVEFLMPALEVAHALGCTFFGGVTYSALGYRSGKPPTEQEYQNIARALTPVARRAADYGIQLGIEPCNRYETHLVNTAQQALDLLARIGEPNVVIHLDTYHMNIEEKGIGHGFGLAGHHAPYIHVSESDRGVPGTGTVDWEDAFAALAGIGFSGDLVMESFVSVPPEIAAALAVWRPVARDRHEVLEQGTAYLRTLGRKHGLLS
jgi:D-psicose/D-tagatose/L-ribulose 3-epimerase